MTSQLFFELLCVALAVGLRPAAASAGAVPVTSALPAFAHEARLVPAGDPLGDLYDTFGATVASEGDTLAVGVPGHDLPTRDAGCVYLYERSAGVWTQTAKVTSPDVSTFDRFGSQVSLEGDTLAVTAGSWWDSGRVYVFVRAVGVWSLQATLTSPLQSYGFGADLALSGDSLAIGAPGTSTGFGNRSGAVFVYTRVAETWALEQQVLGFEIAADDAFGAAVALDGDRLAVGAPRDDPGTAEDAGSVYVFERSSGSWSQIVKLIDPAGGMSYRFGWRVGLLGSTLAASAPGQADGRVHVYEEIAGVWIPRVVLVSTTGQGSFGGALSVVAGQMLVGFESSYSSGAAEVFTGGGSSWTPGVPLVPTGLGSSDSYGAAVGLTTGTAIVGAPNRNETGAVWVWTGSGSSWAVQSVLDNVGTATDDGFGSASALDGATLVVGAPDDDTAYGRDSGAAYVFERVGTAWELRQKLVPPPGMGSSWEGPAFGTSVAISGDRLAIGAPKARGQGRVLVYTHTAGGWSPAAELSQSDLSWAAEFGAAVALQGTHLLVGAPRADSGTKTGAVYAFEEAGGVWVPRQKILPHLANGFGAALAISPSGATALAGAPASGAVAALRLEAGGWSEVGSWAPEANGEFGRAVALTDTDAFVGAPAWPGDGGSPVGAVHPLRYSDSGRTWTGLPPLLPPGDDYGQRFGSAIAADGTQLAVGAPRDYYGGGGAVHLFEAVSGSWTPASILGGEAVGDYPRFGASVALRSGRIVVGSAGADSPAGQSSGTVDVFGPSTSDLAIAIAGPSAAEQGTLVTVAVPITNPGPSAVAGVAFRAAAGIGLAFDSWTVPSGTCSRAGGLLACSLSSVPVGTSTVAEIRLAAVAVGSWPVTVEITTSDPNPANDTAALSVAVTPSVADVSLSVAGPTYARVGGTILYSIQLGNAGPGAAAGLHVVWPAPPGLVPDFVNGCDPADCRIARLGNDSTWLQVAFQIPAAYAGPVPVVFSASVSTLSQDPQPGNNQDSHSSAFVPPPTPLGYYTVTPCRLYDSREPGNAPLVPGEARVVSPYYSACGLAYGARALALNVTVTGATAAGNVRVYPAYSPVPNVSTLNYAAGQTRANNVVIGLSPEGDLAVRASQASGTVHVIFDVVGYFE